MESFADALHADVFAVVESVDLWFAEVERDVTARGVHPGLRSGSQTSPTSTPIPPPLSTFVGSTHVSPGESVATICLRQATSFTW